MSPHTAQEVLDRVRMTDLVIAVGGGPVKRGRAKCTLCKSGSEPLSINESKGCWYCHRCGEGGGKVQFVRRALNCEPRAALEWIAELAGVPLAKWTRDQMQARGAEMMSAESEGRWLLDWKEDLIDYLRIKRECAMVVYFMAIRLSLEEHERALWSLIRELDRKIEWHREVSWEWLSDIYGDTITRRVSH